MPSPYSYDLRERVIKCIDSGESVMKVSRLFNISRKVIFDWKKLRKLTGDIKYKTGYHKGPAHKITDLEVFRKFIEDNNDKSSKELAQIWPEKVSASTIIKCIRRLGFSYKKKLIFIPKGILV